jgi:ribosomal protein S30
MKLHYKQKQSPNLGEKKKKNTVMKVQNIHYTHHIAPTD